MIKPLAAIFVIVGAVAWGDTAAEEKLQKLTGTQIRAKVAGMEVTDEIHSADVFASGGSLTSYAMGRKTTGRWRVQKDELCVIRGKDEERCYQVWLSGKKIEFRREGSNLPLEGILQKPQPRN